MIAGFAVAAALVTQTGADAALANGLGCRGARVDRPSLGPARVRVAVLFPVRACLGAAPGSALIVERRGQRWHRIAVVPYDRGANRNDGAYGRHLYRFANDREQPADMWIEARTLIVRRGDETLVRHTLRR